MVMENRIYLQMRINHRKNRNLKFLKRILMVEVNHHEDLKMNFLLVVNHRI